MPGSSNPALSPSLVRAPAQEATQRPKEDHTEWRKASIGFARLKGIERPDPNRGFTPTALTPRGARRGGGAGAGAGGAGGTARVPRCALPCGMCASGACPCCGMPSAAERKLHALARSLKRPSGFSLLDQTSLLSVLRLIEVLLLPVETTVLSCASIYSGAC
jgi:hypothetical protein